jgi:hypothetical protein
MEKDEYNLVKYYRDEYIWYELPGEKFTKRLKHLALSCKGTCHATCPSSCSQNQAENPIDNIHSLVINENNIKVLQKLFKSILRLQGNSFTYYTTLTV